MDSQQLCCKDNVSDKFSSERLLWNNSVSDSFIFAVEEAERSALSLAEIECTPSAFTSSPLTPLLVNSSIESSSIKCTNSTFRSSPQSSSGSSVEEPEILNISSTIDETAENFNSRVIFCGCEKNVIDELCISEAIEIRNSTEFPLIFARCYYNVAN